jgi:hypothetical protein
MNVNGEDFSVDYWPGDSLSGMFGGNSNWRGPLWMPMTFLIIESLQRFHQVSCCRRFNRFGERVPDSPTIAVSWPQLQNRLSYKLERRYDSGQCCR